MCKGARFRAVIVLTLTVAASALSVLPAPATPSPAVGFVVARSGGDDTPTAETLYSVDLLTGVATPIGEVVDGDDSERDLNISSLAFGPGGVLYAVNDADLDEASRLYTIDPASAEATFVGELGPQGFTGLTFGADGATWMSGLNFSQQALVGEFYSVDPLAATATVVGVTADQVVLGLAGDCDGTIYGSATGFDTGTPAELVIMDTDTGDPDPVGELGAGIDLEELPDIAFDHVSGTLWGVTAVGEIFTVDRTIGAATIQATLTFEAATLTGVDNIAIDAPESCPPPPLAGDDNAETLEDTPVNIVVLANDTGTGIEVTVVTDPAQGAAVINPDGTVTYTPDSGFSGQDSFTYTIADDLGRADIATVRVQVAPILSASLTVAVEGGDPVFDIDGPIDDTIVVDEGASVTLEDRPPGVYTITLVDPDDVVVDAVDCGPGGELAVDLPGRSVTVDLADGEDVTCLFTISAVDDDDDGYDTYDDDPGSPGFDFDTPFENGDTGDDPDVDVAGTVDTDHGSALSGDQPAASVVGPGDPAGPAPVAIAPLTLDQLPRTGSDPMSPVRWGTVLTLGGVASRFLRRSLRRSGRGAR